MSIRRINFLTRRRIPWSHVRIGTSISDGRHYFTVTGDLDEFAFPANALLFVDVRQLEHRRFSLGTIEAPRFSRPLELGRQVAESISFNFLVVDPRDARKLGEATGIRPEGPEEEKGAASSLLPVDGSTSLSGPVWGLRFNADDRAGLTDAPLLLIDRRACDGAARVFLADPVKSTLVLPAAMEIILRRVLLEEGHSIDRASEGWRDAWLRFAERVTGQETPSSEGEHNDDLRGWIQDAVDQFSKRHDLLQQFLSGIEQ